LSVTRVKHKKKKKHKLTCDINFNLI